MAGEAKTYYPGERREADENGHQCRYYGDLLGSIGGFPCDVGFHVSACASCGYELHCKSGPDHLLYCTLDCFRALVKAGRIRYWRDQCA